MIKQAYLRGLMKIAQAEVTRKQIQQRQKDRLLANNFHLLHSDLQRHGFYKGTPIIARVKDWQSPGRPDYLRYYQAKDSAEKFSGTSSDPVWQTLRDYYINIGRQNRDFYLKQGFRPPKDYKYKTPFPYPNHPKKKQMMDQNQWQVRNTSGRSYNNVV